MMGEEGRVSPLSCLCPGALLGRGPLSAPPNPLQVVGAFSPFTLMPPSEQDPLPTQSSWHFSFHPCRSPSPRVASSFPQPLFLGTGCQCLVVT